MRLAPLAHDDDDVGAVFLALGDGTRRHVVERLRDGSTLTPSSLAADLPVTRQAISKHLAVLDAAGLVTKTRAGRETRYRLAPAPLPAVCAEWDARLARLDDLLTHRRAADPDPASGE